MHTNYIALIPLIFFLAVAAVGIHLLMELIYEPEPYRVMPALEQAELAIFSVAVPLILMGARFSSLSAWHLHGWTAVAFNLPILLFLFFFIGSRTRKKYAPS